MSYVYQQQGTRRRQAFATKRNRQGWIYLGEGDDQGMLLAVPAEGYETPGTEPEEGAAPAPTNSFVTAESAAAETASAPAQEPATGSDLGDAATQAPAVTEPQAPPPPAGEATAADAPPDTIPPELTPPPAGSLGDLVATTKVTKRTKGAASNG